MRLSSANLLRAFSIWTVFVWVVFIRNIWRDASRSTGFKTVHTALAVASVSFAVVCWAVVRRERHAAKAD